MAINPNTDFSTGSILTADQQNRFPRGIMAQASGTGNVSVGTTEAVTITASTFTAVANRYYRLTYFEPIATPDAGAGNWIQLKIRLNNATGAIYAAAQSQATGATAGTAVVTLTSIATFSAGSVVLVGTAQVNAGTGALYRSGDFIGRILVEDIGPA